MATYVGSFRYGSESDAEFRAWAARLRDLLVSTSGGLITQTADTGQMDFATSPKPTAMATRLFFMLKFDDGLGPAIFIRLECGTAGNLINIGMAVQVGTATDGAGNLVGAKIVSPVYANTAGTLTASGKDRVCVVPGFIGMVAGEAYNTAGATLFTLAISRSQDMDGQFDADGVMVVMPQSALVGLSQGSRTAGLSFTTGVIVSTDFGAAVVPLGLPSLNLDGLVQPGPVLYAVDRIRVSGTLCAVAVVDVAFDSEIKTNLAGGVSRTYRRFGLRPDNQISGTGNYMLLGLWE